MSSSAPRTDTPTLVRQVGKALDDAYTALIDMSDFGNRKLEQLTAARRSRALAAHAVRITTGWTPEQAAACVIDGGGDQGIDAIAVVPETKHIYLVQAKWSETGTARADETAVQKLFAGFTLIDTGESGQFNPRGQVLAKRARNLIMETTVTVTQVIVLMGTEPPSPGVRQAIANGEKEFNHYGDYVTHRFIHAPEIHALARADQRSEPISLEATFQHWFSITSPHQSYQGVMQAEEVAEWARHDNRLFDLNIRNPLGLTPINSELVTTLTDEPAHFWYFNNGITILCDSLDVVTGSKKFPERHSVRLTAHGASVVNGAQTVRAIIDAAKEDGDAELAQVGVRIIVTGEDSEFAKRTTQATNRQNHITDRDYIALDPVQAALIEEFHAELGLVYSVRRSELEPQGDEGCSVVEAACALACAHSSSRHAARLVAAESTDVLWERGATGIYDPLFRSIPGVFAVWNAVNVLRTVRKELRTAREQYQGRGAAVIDDGTFLLTHLAFRLLLADDAGMGEPDPSLSWAKTACAQVPELLKRVVPALLHCLDEDFGPRSDLKRVCIEDAKCTDLVASVLRLLETGGTADPAKKYHRDANKPRKPRRPNAVHVIVNQRVLSEGAPLTLNLYAQSEQEALAEWLAADPLRSRATWTNNRSKPIIWSADRQAYSPSGLISRMWELADWEERPVSNQGTARWTTTDGETLADLAWRLLGGLDGGENE